MSRIAVVPPSNSSAHASSPHALAASASSFASYGQTIWRNQSITTSSISVAAGEEVDFDGLVAALSAAGYERKQSVEERGEFAVRGGVIDVFASTGREPIRVELFGDEVERVSAFSLFTQRSMRDLERIDLYPAAEERNRHTEKALCSIGSSIAAFGSAPAES